MEIIKENWMNRVQGSASFVLMRKLSNVRQVLKKWSLQKRWSDFDENLSKELEEIFEGKGVEDYEREDDKLKEFASAAAIYWKQRAKLCWCVEGDTCTRYFFN
ncbi:hypothetical protein RND81_04G201000 [Saponaria officinalis]|uniref:Uncharacterized protein n=1 Tax=Saponaria officinalis TaxID=3572 RepID=A0AAW1LFG3_SAPOF